MTLALFVKRKNWPRALKIALLLFKAVLSFLHFYLKSFPLLLLTIFVAEEIFFINHTFQLEMWHIWTTLNNYGKTTNFAEKYTRTVVTLSVLQLKAMLYCTVPQMTPRPQMIPKMDRKWSSTASDPQSWPQMIPWKLEEWNGFYGTDYKKRNLFLAPSKEKGKEDATSQVNLYKAKKKVE